MKKKTLYKKIGPLLGNILDKLFFTDFARRSLNYYHKYNQNDYTFSKEEYCFVHVPRTGGWSFRNYCEKYKLPLYKNDKGGHHNPVSMMCSSKDYKYVTIIRDPIQRVRSHFQMSQKAGEVISSRGLINFLRYNYEVKNLYCQYYSGFIDEVVDERVYNIAIENLKYFKFIINFNNYENDIKKFLNQFDLKDIEDNFYDNKSDKINLTSSEKKAIELYNYWDIKLFEKVINKN